MTDTAYRVIILTALLLSACATVVATKNHCEIAYEREVDAGQDRCVDRINPLKTCDRYTLSQDVSTCWKTITSTCRRIAESTFKEELERCREQPR